MLRQISKYPRFQQKEYKIDQYFKIKIDSDKKLENHFIYGDRIKTILNKIKKDHLSVKRQGFINQNNKKQLKQDKFQVQWQDSTVSIVSSNYIKTYENKKIDDWKQQINKQAQQIKLKKQTHQQQMNSKKIETNNQIIIQIDD